MSAWNIGLHAVKPDKKKGSSGFYVGYAVVMRQFLVNQYVAPLGMEQPALLKHVGSTALRVAVARLRNSPCPSASRDTAQTVLAVRRLPMARRTASAREVPVPSLP
jgi:hypothetical protein